MPARPGQRCAAERARVAEPAPRSRAGTRAAGQAPAQPGEHRAAGRAPRSRASTAQPGGHGAAGLVDDGEIYVATGIARLRVLKKPRADELRSVMRITGPNPLSSSAFSLDALLFEGDVPIMELSA